MALIVFSILVLAPLVLLVADTLLGFRREDKEHVPYATKVGYDSMSASVAR